MGLATAQSNAAHMFANGEGTPHDYARYTGAKRLQSQQTTDAMYNLGVLHQQGLGRWTSRPRGGGSLTPRTRATGRQQPLRFDVGARVLAYTGDGPVDDGWSPGTVVALRYEEEGLEMPAPYQVALDEPEGVIIYAPLDDDRVVRAHVEE